MKKITLLIVFCFYSVSFSQNKPIPKPKSNDYNLNKLPIPANKRLWQGIPQIECTQKGRIFISWYSGSTEKPKPENEEYLASKVQGRRCDSW